MFEAQLRDGTNIRIRPIVPGDRAALSEFHEGLSSRTVYLRFFAAHPHLSDSDLDYFTVVDQARRVALVAESAAGIVGVGRFDLLAGPDSNAGDGIGPETRAEVAFVITDRMQGLGLGRLLLSRLADIARGLGVQTFVAEVLPANTRMLETFRHSGYAVTEQVVEDVVEVSVQLTAP